MPWARKEDRNAAAKRRRDANRDAAVEYQRQWRADNIEKVRASARAWYRRNKASKGDSNEQGAGELSN